MEVFDCCIIGGGVVGAAIFNKLVRVGKSALLLDKASDVATGASKANSGLVHAGYDPEPGSLKAKLNVRGNALYPALCKRLGVALDRCGAFVVGDDKEKIEALLNRAKQNGVEAKFCEREEILKTLPNLADGVKYALFAPNAYVVSPYLLTISLVDEGILNGGKVALEQDLASIQKVTKNRKEVFEIVTKTDVFYAKTIVNSAGQGYNDVAKILGTERKKLELRKGEYFVFDKTSSLSVPCTVFPLPTALGKGVLVTKTIDGNHLVGPTSSVSNGTVDVTREGLEQIKQKSALSISGINFRQAIRQFSGVRVISGDDFVIEKSKKVSGVINLAGICSPGLSSAPAIAEMVLKLLNIPCTEQKGLKKLPKFTLFKNMTPEEQQKALKKNPAYGQIVCKCERITKGDILSALNRPLAVHSVDGVKRRTNAGMGRCQGGFCFTKVVAAIMQARGLEYEQVLKENRGSNVALGEIRGTRK